LHLSQSDDNRHVSISSPPADNAFFYFSSLPEHDIQPGIVWEATEKPLPVVRMESDLPDTSSYKHTRLSDIDWWRNDVETRRKHTDKVLWFLGIILVAEVIAVIILNNNFGQISSLLENINSTSTLTLDVVQANLNKMRYFMYLPLLGFVGATLTAFSVVARANAKPTHLPRRPTGPTTN